MEFSIICTLGTRYLLTLHSIRKSIISFIPLFFFLFNRIVPNAKSQRSSDVCLYRTDNIRYTVVQFSTLNLLNVSGYSLNSYSTHKLIKLRMSLQKDAPLLLSVIRSRNLARKSKLNRGTSGPWMIECVPWSHIISAGEVNSGGPAIKKLIQIHNNAEAAKTL